MDLKQKVNFKQLRLIKAFFSVVEELHLRTASKTRGSACGKAKTG